MVSSHVADPLVARPRLITVFDAFTWLILAVVLLAVPRLAGDFFAYELALYLLYGIVAQGIALTWGVAGFLSLGQALFFGLGGYLAGHLLRQSDLAWGSVWFLPVSILVPGLLAYIVGRLVFARRHESGPYFALITLALVMFGFQLANQWSSATGGFNGLGGIKTPFGLDRYGNYYYVVVVACLLSTALVAWLIRTPLGTLWAAIAQNENRVQFLGFRSDHLKALAFGVSAGLGGLAGALFAGHQGIVTPQATSVILSAELIIWTAVGGRRSPYGALLGAVVIGMLSTELRDHFAYWEVIIAIIFIAVVMRFPDGILGAVQWLGARLPELRGTSAARVAEMNELEGTAPNHEAVPLPPRSANRTAPPPRHRRSPVTVSLRFDDVRVSQGSVQILNGLTFSIEGRGIYCVIGPNGAGKTSSFNVLTGRLPLTEGNIEFLGKRVNRWRADAMTRLGVGRKFQIPSVFPELSVAENLSLALWANRARFRDLLGNRIRYWQSDMQRELLREFPMLLSVAHLPAGQISQGQRQMLEFAMTACTEPLLFLLDEPCAGLSVAETHHLSRVMKLAIERLEAAALIVEHDMSAVEALADEVFVFHQGQLLAQGSYADIRDNSAVQAVYAGGRK